MRTDLYATLGVDPDADAATVRAAYLRLMREHHPDHRPGDERAADAAREANAAYEVLGDAVKRAAYDRLRTPRGHGKRAPIAAVTIVRPPAYSEERVVYQQAFSAATMKAGVVLLLVGVLLSLLTFAVQ
jgi:DnaJ-class molecular chaperone